MKETDAKQIVKDIIEALEANNMRRLGGIFLYLESINKLSFILAKRILNNRRLIDTFVLKYPKVFKKHLAKKVLEWKTSLELLVL